MITEVKMEVNGNKYLIERITDICNNSLNKDISHYKYLFVDKYAIITCSGSKQYYKENNYEKIDPLDFIMSNGEQKWLPKFGEKVELSDDNISWEKRKYKAYLPQYSSSFIDEGNIEWKYCRPIQRNKTILTKGE